MVNRRGGGDSSRLLVGVSVCSLAKRVGRLLVETISIYETFSTATTATGGQRPKRPVSRSDMIARGKLRFYIPGCRRPTVVTVAHGSAVRRARFLLRQLPYLVIISLSPIRRAVD